MFQTTISEQYDTNYISILINDDNNSFLSSIPDDCIDLIITSPPYNISKPYETKLSLNEYLESQSIIIYKLIKKT